MIKFKLMIGILIVVGLMFTGCGQSRVPEPGCKEVKDLVFGLAKVEIFKELDMALVEHLFQKDLRDLMHLKKIPGLYLEDWVSCDPSKFSYRTRVLKEMRKNRSIAGFSLKNILIKTYETGTRKVSCVASLVVELRGKKMETTIKYSAQYTTEGRLHVTYTHNPRRT